MIVLGQRALASNFALQSFQTVDSTNAVALDWSRRSQEDRRPAWFVSVQQTAGRGRQGRVWSSPPGNLYSSLLLRDPCPPRDAAKLGFVAALAVLGAIESLCSVDRSLALKWPNDVLLEGAKVSGILLEATQSGDASLSVAIGIGINLAFFPDDTPYPATSLAAMGCPVSPKSFFLALSDQMAIWLERFDRGRNFSSIRAEWLKYAHGVGGPLIARLATGSIEGLFEGVDVDGRLLLFSGNKTHEIDAGDVYFPSLSALGAM